MEQIAILKNPRLWVDDRDLVTLRFDACQEGSAALQVIYLEGPPQATHSSRARLVELIRAAGSFDKLDGLPIIVERGTGTMTYVRPASV